MDPLTPLWAWNEPKVWATRAGVMPDPGCLAEAVGCDGGSHEVTQRDDPPNSAANPSAGPPSPGCTRVVHGVEQRTHRAAIGR